MKTGCRLIGLTEETATILYESPQNQGDFLEFEIQLPEEILLDSFTISGTVTASEYVKNNGSSGYLTRMEIGRLSDENRKILNAYVAFLRQEKELDEIHIDYEGLQKAIDRLSRSFLQIVSLAEQLKEKTAKKVTIH